ncbi:hypothetical protein BG74_05825 [Sodalis-like endosymbiont of Proechinophthirus fluctus]|uniref:hypothetical protein n=1 Tax=Sodalis-like endosymbiont of Proechinophthirus fluctus TaxID=1462730 RepID=UPI0007A90D52|nr:hypothetical protein [Sodalis-like endosymbiont of Proechinophthirus fluctus]KYP97054.1 hypothetical protein BG74_05825 [Sodalis-like endosymbiont of Proechinophthirus fluctus]
MSRRSIVGGEPETGLRLQVLRANDQVDYAQLITLKLMTLCSYALAQFNRRSADDHERQSLADFVVDGGISAGRQRQCWRILGSSTRTKSLF